jgi:aromatic ring-opening dioxygenase LigB subunit
MWKIVQVNSFSHFSSAQDAFNRIIFSTIPMNVKGTLINIDDAVIEAARKEGYRKGWNDRKLQDSGIIEEAIRESRNFREFIAALREKMEMLEE